MGTEIQHKKDTNLSTKKDAKVPPNQDAQAIQRAHAQDPQSADTESSPKENTLATQKAHTKDGLVKRLIKSKQWNVWLKERTELIEKRRAAYPSMVKDVQYLERGKQKSLNGSLVSCLIFEFLSWIFS
ncbi:hypothetical protein C922_04482 [Plasmodium inui San Antonio 1]|uniref:Uncharacterized protein n=1 Tax=Plasmodium inui San Antonio 1 TaxID=1237626 RepID=W6ZWD5_9APIC|nr:hypothetical protein C922_04482 [Plasmodium inui San Antonio 1]EUD65082.1 hypothetical protein C922_04482 [Plasmodium inui San Antonio 1]